LPTSNSTEATPPAVGEGFRARRIAGDPGGLALDFVVLRARAPALSLGAFALLCGVMPALGLSALLPLDTANASAMVSLALIGGFAAPFVLASLVFAALSIYLLSNTLHVEVRDQHVRTERRVFGCITRRRDIARADIADVEPRIGARYQNVFSTTPRYALVARHATTRAGDVVVAEDLAGQAVMLEVRTLLCAALGLKIN
jgi:hypothetical protein